MMGWWLGCGLGSGLGWGGALFGGLISLLFLGLLVGLAIWAIRAFSKQSGVGLGRASGHPLYGADDRALAVLKERYARGEIDRDTYDRTRRGLSI